MRVALYLAHCPPIWLPRLLSHWSSSQTVPLTLVLRLLASAELWLFRTSLPGLIISRTIDLSGLNQDAPFGLMQIVP
jgi:hypothetical protein